jgi:glucokinase
MPVSLLNDCNAAVLGEQAYGAGRGKQNIVYITISTGIGAGVVAGGALLLGRGGNAAEVGHFIVDTAYNLPCLCGKGKGHWERYASGAGMPVFFRHWAHEHGRKINRASVCAKDIFEAARAGDPPAREFLDEVSKINARGISNVIAAYDPQIITLGGSVTLSNGKIILAGIKKYIDRFLKPPVIMITPLGEDISLVGAAAAIYNGGLSKRHFNDTN